MGRVSERDIVAFAVEFVNKVCEINEELILEGEDTYSIRFGEKKLCFFCILEGNTVEDCLIRSFPEMDVREFTDHDDCVAYLCCEGTLYEKLYGYDEWREDIFGDGDEAERLYDALFKISEKYGLTFDWAGGALIFYDAGEQRKELLQ